MAEWGSFRGRFILRPETVNATLRNSFSSLLHVLSLSTKGTKKRNEKNCQKPFAQSRNKLIDFEEKRMLEIPNDEDYMIGLLMSL
jgi:hypothetical protein